MRDPTLRTKVQEPSNRSVLDIKEKPYTYSVPNLPEQLVDIVCLFRSCDETVTVWEALKPSMLPNRQSSFLLCRVGQKVMQINWLLTCGCSDFILEQGLREVIRVPTCVPPLTRPKVANMRLDAGFGIKMSMVLTFVSQLARVSLSGSLVPVLEFCWKIWDTVRMDGMQEKI